ncbi:hypothetical protein PMIN03_012834 [Paraphaeosphaeria minitans]
MACAYRHPSSVTVHLHAPVLIQWRQCSFSLAAGGERFVCLGKSFRPKGSWSAGISGTMAWLGVRWM